MSNLKAKNKKTGEIVEYFMYGKDYHIQGMGLYICSKEWFNELYEPIPNLEERFNKEFVDEDTGLLNISKYDYERIINFFKNEIK